MLAHICRRSIRHAIKETEYLNESYVNNYNTRLMLYMDLLVIQ